MKNKNLKYITVTIFIISFLLSAPGVLKRPAFAWSTYTHAAISAEALSKYPALMPGAVYGSSLPDITTNFISPASKDKFYSIFHGEKFQKAVVALLSKLDKKNGRVMLSNIYGYLSHITADKIAHTPQSYASAKKTFSVKTELNHYTAYLFMDMLCYYDYFYGYNSKFGKFVPDADYSFVSAALAEYNGSNAGGEPAELSRSEFAKKEAAFKAGITVQKAIFDILIDENPELFEQLRSFYYDYQLGVNGAGGFYDAAAAVEEKITAGDYSQISGGGFKSFVDRQINDITYIGMQFCSLIAKDTEFIRTSKLSSDKLESFVTKFFESKSASTKAMGKFLSALLLKKGLTYEQIIDYTDGTAAAAKKESDKSLKYKNAYKKLKEPRWYSFIPGTGSKEKREYIDAFIEYQKEKTGVEIKESGLSGAPADALRAAENKRLSTYREAYLASKLNPLDYISKKAACDAAFTGAGVAKSYIKAKIRANAAGNTEFSRALDLKAAAFIAKNLKAQKIAAGRNLSYKLLNPLKSIYEKEYILHSSLNNAGFEKIKAILSGDLVQSHPAGVLETEDGVNPGGFADPYAPAARIETNGGGHAPGAKPDLNNALKLMQNAYKEYVDTLNSYSIDEIESQGVRAELNKRLNNYIRLKTVYEKLYYTSGAEADSAVPAPARATKILQFK
jgi:phosphopantetheinyl transferase (holo-ACP synthase)